ncbi:carboxypeptidase-like regulatory domain-containing protein, partial [Parabacteroides goldsteinii]|uniref:carboxypeptidase-like regulatory domain-containing protein n=2 Tax=Tannerellaceae TaxID=2005525 RepID=UPI0026DB010D
MKYYLFLIILSLTSILQAQNIVKGNIKDESNIDLPAVTIKVLSLDSTMIKGGITDNNGYFQFEDIDAGKYILAISHIGYINQYFNFEMYNSTLELPTIILKTNNILLNDVTITASSFIKKNDHLLIIPDKKQIKNSFSGYDVLYNLMIPGLTVNRKTKTVNAVTGGAS